MSRAFKQSVKAVLGPIGLLPQARELYWRLKGPTLVPSPGPAEVVDPAYQSKIAQERATYDEMVNVHDLPAIFHYWSNKYLLPKCQTFGFSHPDEFFANHLLAAASPSGKSRFVSVGAGNCDTEVRIATLLKARGLGDFSIECLDINDAMLARGHQLAIDAGVAGHIKTTAMDFNNWTPDGKYHAVMANQSLHHVVNLEHLFDAIADTIGDHGRFVISDTIGRNGHLRWPEALEVVHQFWRELPQSYRRNLQLSRDEPEFLDWDCSTSGFEGIRAQDILPLLVDRFQFHSFLPFANAIDPFIDRGFGHHYNPENAWDRDFIDRLHAADEERILDGRLKPTHMFAVLGGHAVSAPSWWAGLSPASCVRRPRDLNLPGQA